MSVLHERWRWCMPLEMLEIEQQGVLFFFFWQRSRCIFGFCFRFFRPHSQTTNTVLTYKVRPNCKQAAHLTQFWLLCFRIFFNEKQKSAIVAVLLATFKNMNFCEIWTGTWGSFRLGFLNWGSYPLQKVGQTHNQL